MNGAGTATRSGFVYWAFVTFGKIITANDAACSCIIAMLCGGVGIGVRKDEYGFAAITAQFVANRSRSSGQWPGYVSAYPFLSFVFAMANEAPDALAA